MATKPTALPRWATNPLPGGVVEPPETGDTGSKDRGHVPNVRPPAQWENWLKELYYRWCAYLDDLENQALTWTKGAIFTQSTANTIAVRGFGNGTASGVEGNGGNSSGTGVAGVGGSGSGNGVSGIGTGNGYGVVGTGAGTGYGGQFIGGNTNGYGVVGLGGGTAPGVRGVGGATSGAGVEGVGSIGSAGVTGQGGVGNGPGVSGTGGSSSGVGVLGTGGSGGTGVSGVGNGAGAGVSGTGGTSGPGIVGTGGSGQPGVSGTGGSNGLGGFFTGNGSGAGLLVFGGGTGRGVVASGGGGAAAVEVGTGGQAFTGAAPAKSADPGLDNYQGPSNIVHARGTYRFVTGGTSDADRFLAGFNASVSTSGATVTVTFARPMASANYSLAIRQTMPHHTGTTVFKYIEAPDGDKTALGFEVHLWDLDMATGAATLANWATNHGFEFIVSGEQ